VELKQALEAARTAGGSLNESLESLNKNLIQFQDRARVAEALCSHLEAENTEQKTAASRYAEELLQLSHVTADATDQTVALQESLASVMAERDTLQKQLQEVVGQHTTCKARCDHLAEELIQAQHELVGMSKLRTEHAATLQRCDDLGNQLGTIQGVKIALEELGERMQRANDQLMARNDDQEAIIDTLRTQLGEAEEAAAHSTRGAVQKLQREAEALSLAQAVQDERDSTVKRNRLALAEAKVALHSMEVLATYLSRAKVDTVREERRLNNTLESLATSYEHTVSSWSQRGVTPPRSRTVSFRGTSSVRHLNFDTSVATPLTPPYPPSRESASTKRVVASPMAIPSLLETSRTTLRAWGLDLLLHGCGLLFRETGGSLEVAAVLDERRAEVQVGDVLTELGGVPVQRHGAHARLTNSGTALEARLCRGDTWPWKAETYTVQLWT